jgi:hypothetical protein
MTSPRVMIACFFAISMHASATSAAVPDDASLREADAMQMRIIVEEDAAAQQEFMHPNYIINAPSNRILRKEQLVAMLAEGQMASESFERTIEATSITQDVGIVMGRETVTPSPGSELGRRYGDERLERRFTNVFLWLDGRWRFLARQATVVAPLR